ncbi:MAG: sigma-70 family RNA polymerase sigma factor [Opitutaceae bacterium]
MPAATRDAPPSADSPASHRQPQFATTRWSIVLRAGRTDAAQASAALDRLCQTYWFPVYAQVRHRGCNAHDAQDLTQGFFARLLEGDMIARADPARGRFRSLVLTALKHFLTDEWEKTQAQKRGGGRAPVSIDAASAEQRFHAEPIDASAPPDQAFDRQWAVALLGEVLAKLEREYDAAGKARHFAVLKPALTGPRDTQPYAQLAAELGTSEGAIKIAVHRLRRRYRQLLEMEIAHTVATPEDAAAELNYLFRALAG